MLRQGLPVGPYRSNSSVSESAINNSLLEWFAFRLLRNKMFSLAVAHKFAICNPAVTCYILAGF